MEFDIGAREFELGDGATCMLKPLNVIDFQKVLKLMDEISKAGAKGKGKKDGASQSIADLESMHPVAKDLLPNYVTEVKGITVTDGNEKRDATVKDIINQGAFMVVQMNMLTGLMNISSPSKLEAGNSVGSPQE